VEHHRFQNANRTISPYDQRGGEVGGELESQGSGLEKLGWGRPSDSPDFKPRPAEVQRLKGADSLSTGFWPAVFNFFLDGFASYAACLHRTSGRSAESFEVVSSPIEVRAKSPSQPANEHEHDSAWLFEQSSVRVELDQFPPFDGGHRIWLNSVWHPVVGLLAELEARAADQEDPSCSV